MLNLFQHPLVKRAIFKGLRVSFPNDEQEKMLS